MCVWVEGREMSSNHALIALIDIILACSRISPQNQIAHQAKVDFPLLQ